MSKKIYKVIDRTIWQTALQSGLFHGAEIDLKDGFIHLSARDQVAETVRKHFSGRENLLLIEIETAALAPLGDALRWEESRGGQEFPHLYATLDVNLIAATYELPMGADGNHQFPIDMLKS